MQIKDQEIHDVGKIRGEKNIIKSVVDHSAAEMKQGTPYCLVYGNNPESAEELSVAMTAKVGYEPAFICQIGAEIVLRHGGG